MISNLNNHNYFIFWLSFYYLVAFPQSASIDFPPFTPHEANVVDTKETDINSLSDTGLKLYVLYIIGKFQKSLFQRF